MFAQQLMDGIREKNSLLCVGLDLSFEEFESTIGEAVYVSATQSQDAEAARHLMPNSIFLVPEYGSQGGGAMDALAGCDEEDGTGVIVNSSSGITNAWKSDPYGDHIDAIAAAAQAARNDLHAAHSVLFDE